jgi:thioredoxin-like negative regulator of GroEL
MERVGAEAFDGNRLRRTGTVAVAFSADWCPFCREFMTEFAALDRTDRFQTLVGDVTDLSSPLWETFDLDVVPTIVAFRDGRSVFRADGRLGEGLSREDLTRLRSALA